MLSARRASKSAQSTDLAPQDGDDDRRLLELLRAGDERAFAELVERLSPALMRLALAHLPSRAVAEEVVQEVWLAVIGGIERFEGRCRLRSWIIQITLNKARSRGKREQRVVPLSSLGRPGEEGSAPAVDPTRFASIGERGPGSWISPPVSWDTPHEAMLRDGARAALLDAVATLPARQREVIVLRDILGHSPAEACEALGLSEGNQRVLLHRARSKVRAALEIHLAVGAQAA